MLSDRVSAAITSHGIASLLLLLLLLIVM